MLCSSLGICIISFTPLVVDALSYAGCNKPVFDINERVQRATSILCEL